MQTRSKKQKLVSLDPEPQRKARLLQKASQLDLTEEVEPSPAMADINGARLDHERNDREEVSGHHRRRDFYEDDGLNSDDEPYEREEYSPIRLPGLPARAADWSIKSNIMANLPKFYGSTAENPHTHLKDLHNQCKAIKPTAVHIERAKLKAFPWSLEGTARVWFNSLTPSSITTWQQMSSTFLKKFWSISKAKTFEKDTVALHQKSGMSYAEYYKKWKETQDIWPMTSLTRKQIIGYLTSGLTGEEQEKLRWSAGGDVELLSNDEKMDLLEKVYEMRALQDREKTGSSEMGAVTAQLAKLTSSLDTMTLENKSLQNQLMAKPVNAVQEIAFMPPQEVYNIMENPDEISVQNSDELIPVNAVLTQNIPVSPRFPYGGSQYMYKHQPGFKWNQNQQNHSNQAQTQNQGQPQGQGQFSNQNQNQWVMQGFNKQHNRGGQQSNQVQNNWNNNQGWNNQGRQQGGQSSRDILEAYIAQNNAAMKSMQEQIQQMTNASQQANKGKLPATTENNPKTLHAVTLRSGAVLQGLEKEAVVKRSRKVDPKTIDTDQDDTYNLSLDQFLGGSARLPKAYLDQQYKSTTPEPSQSPGASSSDRPQVVKEKLTADQPVQQR